MNTQFLDYKSNHFLRELERIGDWVGSTPRSGICKFWEGIAAFNLHIIVGAPTEFHISQSAHGKSAGLKFTVRFSSLVLDDLQW